MASTARRTPRHSKRPIKKSKRARESDEPIPGIDSSLELADEDNCSVNMNNRGKATDLAIQTPPDTPIPKPSKKKKSNRCMPATRRQRKAAAEQQQQPEQQRDYLDRLFLSVYTWPAPRPSDFTQLSDRHKQFKVAQDAHEAATDKDPELDEWHEKCGRAEAYGTGAAGEKALNYSIARTCILRAKRAMRAGRSWRSFEDEELSIDSEAQARAQVDTNLRQILEEEAVNNDSRLRIFQAIRKRLCEEIWLQQYDEETLHA